MTPCSMQEIYRRFCWGRHLSFLPRS